MARDYAALGRFIRARRTVPFGWAPPAQDCCDFVFGGVAAQTGVDHWASERRRYSTVLGGAKVLARCGGVEGILDARLRPVPRAQALRGDVGLVLNHDNEPTAVLVEGDILWAVGLRHLLPLPRAMMIRAWSAD